MRATRNRSEHDCVPQPDSLVTYPVEFRFDYFRVADDPLGIFPPDLPVWPFRTLTG